MTSLKQIKVAKLCKSFPAGVANAWSPRCFVTATTTLQKSGKTDKEVEQTCEEVSEAAGVVKETAKVVTKVTKEVGGKLSRGADEFVKEAKEAVIGPAKEKISETAQEKIKDKIVGK